MTDLSPCPFCGEAPITVPSGNRGAGTMIECLTPGCVNPHVSYYGDGEAARRWNRRTATAIGEGQRLLERATLDEIAKRARSDGDRTFDDCIRDLGLIDDLCRAAASSRSLGVPQDDIDPSSNRRAEDSNSSISQSRGDQCSLATEGTEPSGPCPHCGSYPHGVT